MRLSVIFDDALVMKDGVGYRVTLPDEPDVHAIQWSGETGEIEYRDQHTPNEAIDDESVLAPYLALWQAAHDAASAPPAEPPRRLIRKSLVQERIHAIGKWDAMIDAIMPDGRPSIFYARWFAPNHPNVYFDDPDLLAMLAAVGCTQAQIDAVTAP